MVFCISQILNFMETISILSKSRARKMRRHFCAESESQRGDPLFHRIRLNLLMKFEGLFVMFGPRVPLFWANLGYFGPILAILNMVPFLSRWTFFNEFCCKVMIFLYPSDICIIVLPYNVPLWLLTPPNMLKDDNFGSLSTFLMMFGDVKSHNGTLQGSTMIHYQKGIKISGLHSKIRSKMFIWKEMAPYSKWPKLAQNSLN